MAEQVKTVPVMFGTRCNGCRERIIGEGVFIGKVGNGNSVFYCQGCYLDCRIRGVKLS